MKPTVPLMMWGWIPLVISLFQRLTHRRAAITSIILAWMFLPEYAYSFPGIPDYDKKTATTLAVFLVTCIYARHRISRLKFDFQDLIVILWCFTPMVASLTNGLGAYDGFAASKNYVTIWLIPYYVGRMYLSDWDSLRDLVWGVFIGGLIYAPFCWVEIVMSPQMHMWVYGWHPHDFIQSLRGNSYRPVLFMHHGLMVGMWMAAASLCGLTLLANGEAKKMIPFMKRYGVPGFVKPWMIVSGLVFTFAACQSMGAQILFIQALFILYLSKRYKTKLLLILLLIYPAWKMMGSVTGIADSTKTLEIVRSISEERAASLQFRLDNEKILVEKAMERPVFGWGGWGRSRVRDHTGKDICVTDAYWVIVLGTTGIVGIVSFLLVVSLPVVRLLRKFPRDGWIKPEGWLVLPLLILLPLYAQDCLLNDMKNPIFMVIAGGLITISRVSGLFMFTGMETRATTVFEIRNTEFPSIKSHNTRYI